MINQPSIFVVDDDPAVSRAIHSVGQLLDLPVVSFPSADHFMTHFDPRQAGCLVLDIKMPGTTGIELLRSLSQEVRSLPVIMISGHADVRIAVEAMSTGAMTLLEKPFRLDELTKYIRQAIGIDQNNRAALEQKEKTDALLAQLTAKEQEVFDLISSGKSNKQIAAALHLSRRAVEDRRARLMKKLGARSVVDLLHLHSHSP